MFLVEIKAICLVNNTSAMWSYPSWAAMWRAVFPSSSRVMTSQLGSLTRIWTLSRIPNLHTSCSDCTFWRPVSSSFVISVTSPRLLSCEELSGPSAVSASLSLFKMLTISRCPFWSAKSIGVLLKLFSRVGFALSSNNIFTTSAWPSRLAKWRGVESSKFKTSTAQLYSLTSAFTTWLCPQNAAWWSAVSPLISQDNGSHPNSVISTWMTSSLPFWLAEWRAVWPLAVALCRGQLRSAISFRTTSILPAIAATCSGVSPP